MSDETTTDPAEPFDQTNGVVDGLEGDDDGTIGDTDTGSGGSGGGADDRPGGVLNENFRGVGEPLDPIDDDAPDGSTAEDTDEAVTPYSEESAT
jgi:hypothetical protein